MGISLANEVELSIFSSTFPHLALDSVLTSIGVECFQIGLSQNKSLYLPLESEWKFSANRFFHMLWGACLVYPHSCAYPMANRIST